MMSYDTAGESEITSLSDRGVPYDSAEIPVLVQSLFSLPGGSEVEQYMYGFLDISPEQQKEK